MKIELIKLVNRKKLGSAVKTEYAEKLKELSEETMIAQSKLLDRALELLFKENETGKWNGRKLRI